VAYCTWQDAQAFAEERAADMNKHIVKVQGLLVPVEANFENQVRRYVDVPVDPVASPGTYAQATQICAMRTCAAFLRYLNETEGTADQQWYPNWLDQQADEMLAGLLSQQGPTDAAPADNPVSFAPSDGLAPETRPLPIFKRANIARGGGHW